MVEAPQDLGDGLVLRFAKAGDVDAMVELFAEIQDEPLARWFRDLLSGDHPKVTYSDHTLVEDVSSRRIVSFMGLISQTWSYGGIPFGCGQVEAVVTRPEYRRRGLVRSQIEVLHALSASRGELMQFIFGIPWFYRQFGYEYALHHFGGGARIDLNDFPPLARDAIELYNIRPATSDDLAFLKKVYEYACNRQPLAATKSDAEWAYYLRGYSANSFGSRKWLVIERLDGETVGYVQYYTVGGYSWADKKHIDVMQLELKPGVGYLDVVAAVLRKMKEIGIAEFAIEPAKAFHGVMLELGTDHPAYKVLPTPYISKDDRALYVRIPQVVAFLRHVSPALERNLIGTVAEGYTGELTVDLFKSGVRFTFDRGRIDDIADTEGGGEARFPDLTFLKLLCGYRRCAELMAAYPDCSVPPAAATLLDSLFPPNKTNPWLGVHG